MKRFFGLLILVAAVFAAASCDQQPPVAEMAPIVIYDGPVDLVDQEFGMYYGDLGHNSVGVYSVVFSDAVCFRDGYGTPYLDSEGDMLVLEFNVKIVNGVESVMLPEGTYMVAADADKTVNVAKSYVKRLVGSTQYHYELVSGSITVSYNSEGGYDLLTEDLVIKKGDETYEVTYSYSGTIKFADWKVVAAGLQTIKDDIIDMPFADVDAAYYGNLFGYGTANYVISFSTEGFVDDESGSVPGVMIVMNMFDEMPSGDELPILSDGTYTVYPSFNSKEFSMLYGMNMDGMPFGTYAFQVDSKGGQALEFISEGTVKVTRSQESYNDVYTFVYDFTTPSRRKISGTWSGPMEIINVATDTDRVILSTLEDDVECDMHRIERGYMSHIETLHTTSYDSPMDIAEAWQLWLQPRMWTDEEKELPWDERIEAWNPNGDVLILEFVAPLDSKGDIAPEVNQEYVYTIQPNLAMDDQLYKVSVSKMGRPYDDIFYSANWDKYTYMTGNDARRGFTWDGGYRGNWYLHYIEGTWQNLDEHAPAVKGTVKVKRTTEYAVATGGREAQFELAWDLYDDTEASNNITGEWSGPITIYSGAEEI